MKKYTCILSALSFVAMAENSNLELVGRLVNEAKELLASKDENKVEFPVALQHKVAADCTTEELERALSYQRCAAKAVESIPAETYKKMGSEIGGPIQQACGEWPISSQQCRDSLNSLAQDRSEQKDL